MADRGLEFNDVKLKRLRRAGLMPSAVQEHAAGVVGSRSYYPDTVLDQLELIAQLERGERRYAQLRILLRWHGGWVEPDKLRESLVTVLSRISRQANKMVRGISDPTEQAHALAEAVAHGRPRSELGKLVRHRMRRSRIPRSTCEFVLAALATNAPLEWENHDPNNAEPSLGTVFKQLSGVDRAETDVVDGHGPLRDPNESIAEMIGELRDASAFELLHVEDLFRDESDDSIQQGFDDATRFARIGPALNIIEHHHGKDVAGLGSITAMLNQQHDALACAFMVRTFITIRPLMAPDALNALTAVLAARS